MSRGTEKPQILPSTISGVSYHSTYKIVTLSRLQNIVSYVSRYSRYFTLHVQCLLFRGKYIATHKSKSTHQSVLCITVSGMLGILMRFISPITIGVTIFCLGYSLYPIVILLCRAHWGISFV
jgi:hypothetical protein